MRTEEILAAMRVQLKNANDTMEAVSKELQRVNSENDALRNKLADTEAALGRANAEVLRLTHELSAMKKAGIQYASAFKYAVEHPFENLWKWVERKLWWAE